MCGIVGVIAPSDLTIEQIASAKSMRESIIHRGPDGYGELIHGQVALLMNRLSIIDVKGGWQPLFNEDKTIALIANGEIYNYVELQQQLKSRGHHLATGSDCETIIHLYEEEGEQCLHKLRGMFAFTLWDMKRRKIFIARDRMGEKPLYYHQKESCFLFASELKAIIASGLVPLNLNPSSINNYFHYGYVPEPDTPILGVSKLPAGHYLTIDLDTWEFKQEKYWDMLLIPPMEGDPIKLIREELESIKDLIIRSDVPVGIALSGGFDSSALACLESNPRQKDIHAFTVGYPGHPRQDERRKAQSLAKQLQMPFHDVEIAASEMIENLPETVFRQDDPIADISGYSYYSVMKKAREQGVPVMLVGQGGDELFWGYEWLKFSVNASITKAKLQKSGKRPTLWDHFQPQFPESLHWRAVAGWLRAKGGLEASRNSYRQNLKAPVNRLIFNDLIRDFLLVEPQSNYLFTSDFQTNISQDNASQIFTLNEKWDRLDIIITDLVCKTFLQENGLAQVDRLSMASSVEVRSPLVDYRLVELVIGLRQNHQDYKLPQKYWLKEALRDIVPKWIASRPKQGFTPPSSEWYAAIFKTYYSKLRDGELVALGIIDPHFKKYYDQGLLSETYIYRAIVLEIWVQQMKKLTK